MKKAPAENVRRRSFSHDGDPRVHSVRRSRGPGRKETRNRRKQSPFVAGMGKQSERSAMIEILKAHHRIDDQENQQHASQKGYAASEQPI